MKKILYWRLLLVMMGTVQGYEYPSLQKAASINQQLEQIIREKNIYDDIAKDKIAQKIVTLYHQSNGPKKELLNNLLSIMTNKDQWSNQRHSIIQRFQPQSIALKHLQTHKQAKICPFIGDAGNGELTVYFSNKIQANLPQWKTSTKEYKPNNFWANIVDQSNTYALDDINQDTKILGCYIQGEIREQAAMSNTSLLFTPSKAPIKLLQDYAHALHQKDRAEVADIITFAYQAGIILYLENQYQPVLEKAIPSHNGVILIKHIDLGPYTTIEPERELSYLTIHQGVLYELFANQNMTEDFYQNNWSLFTQKIKEIEREEVPPQAFTSQETTEGQNLSPDHPCYSDKQSKNFEELVNILLQQKACLDKLQKEK